MNWTDNKIATIKKVSKFYSFILKCLEIKCHNIFDCFSNASVQFSSVQSLSHVRFFATHGLQQIRPPCPSPVPAVYSNSCPLSRWCHATISSSLSPFSSHHNHSQHQGLLKRVSSSHEVATWGGQSIGVSASASVLPMNVQDWFPLGWTGWISLKSKSLLQHCSSKASILWCLAFFIVQHSHPYMTTGKTIALTRWTFVGKVMYLPFNMLSRLVITFLPRSKHLFISWMKSPSAVI